MYWSWLSSVVVVRWHCSPLALSVGVVIGVGIVREHWRCPLASSLALASSVGIVIGVSVVHGRWRRPWVLASSVGIGVVIGVGVVHWRRRRPLASLALSVGVVVVHWLVNGCERTWALVMVVHASGMGVVRCRLSSMVVLVGVSCVTCGFHGCGCG